MASGMRTLGSRGNGDQRNNYGKGCKNGKSSYSNKHRKKERKGRKATYTKHGELRNIEASTPQLCTTRAVDELSAMQALAAQVSLLSRSLLLHVLSIPIFVEHLDFSSELDLEDCNLKEKGVVLKDNRGDLSKGSRRQGNKPREQEKPPKTRAFLKKEGRTLQRTKKTSTVQETNVLGESSLSN
jgi:hypothetical protein